MHCFTMRGFLIIERDRQVVITGVEGAGRRSFASLYFPNINLIEKPVRLSKKCKNVVIVVLLDCCHLQNLAEASVLNNVSAAIKRWKTRHIRLLLVLGRIDLVCSRRQNRDWLEIVMREYCPYLKKIRTRTKTIIAHSNLAVEWTRRALDSVADADDVEDFGYLLSKAGHRMPRFVSAGNLKTYIASHLKSLQKLSGEYYVKNFLKAKKDK